ncbi:MAG: helix-turn-helix domain-containing protein [Cyanobium sp.]
MSSPPSPGQAAAAPGGSSADPAAQEALNALGSRLRRAREASQLEASLLAERLRIGVEQLDALESGDRDRLPEPVFVIAQARRVAGALKIDISEELRALRATDGPGSRGAAGASQGPGAGAPIPWRLPLMAAGVVLVAAAMWGGWTLATSVLTGRSTQNNPPLVPPGRPISPPEPRALDAPPGRLPSAADAVVFESRQPSWIEVRRPDGTVLFRGLLSGSRTFPLAGGLQVLAGRPDLVSRRIGSGAAQVLGPISDVRWRSLSAPR